MTLKSTIVTSAGESLGTVMVAGIMEDRVGWRERLKAVGLRIREKGL